ncbi:long-chain fatty acid--CoA ligase [Geodermatophilus sp. TF02-6]|uniref:class I adenylate-forming enzyme family protein n=1 Tax=Geodermatophilus sp. TF02-6 TaxID=2250575 RepID=UPI000DEA0427|nr:AMP-binding protein [Geodermatophilus sp. TF02-6]RBY78917.1 long-chain fatty acid--CoA ligase [Geodermatophilus sp. TF02-6]
MDTTRQERHTPGPWYTRTTTSAEVAVAQYVDTTGSVEQPRPSPGRGPFDASGLETGPDGVRRYTGLAQNLLHLLRSAVDAHPDAEALVELGGERVTYRQLWDRGARVAGGLRAAGVHPGDRVANRLPNGNDWVHAFWGTLLAGAVVVPVNTRFAEPEVRYVVEDSGAAYVVEPGAPLPDGDPVEVTDQGHTDLAAIFYTSGTTGFPKGAMTTHENFLSNVETCLRCLTLPRDEQLSTLISVPLFHVTGCNSQLLVVTALAGTSVVMPVFEVQAFLQAIEEERIDVLTTVPAIYWLALQQPNFADVDTSSVRALSYGGAPIAPDLVHRIQQAFPSARVGNGFGLTETSSVSTYLPHEYAAEHADSVGFPAPVVDVDLADADPHTGVGELLIRGPNVVAGYWNKPEQTRQTFVDGWLHSGDLARIDDGLVHIVDRKKDMINRGGENVYCVEVENALAAHPAVGEVAVLGVPDPMMGEKVGAVVVPQPGQQLDAGELLAFARERLADFKVPQYVAVRGEPLPRNPGGKVLKPPLREQTDWQPVR